MNARTSRNVVIEDAEIKTILFRNFSGKPDKFHPSGTIGNFTVVLDEAKAKELLDRGFDVKLKQDRDGNDEYRLRIFVRFDHVPPKVFMLSGKSMTELTEETIACLDSAELSKAEMVINPYRYEVGDRTGIKAYLTRGYFTIADDLLAERYANFGADEDGDSGVPWSE